MEREGAIHAVATAGRAWHNRPMDGEIIARIGAGAVCVTATERLAEATRRAYGRAMAESGAKAWPAPEALSWSAWVSVLWESLWQPEAVAPALAARVLWEEIIAADAESSGLALLDVPSTAAGAAEAERLVALYGITVGSAFDGEEESRAFRRWRERYATELSNRGWVAAERLEARLTALVGDAGLRPRELVLLGFDEEPPPARRALLDALGMCGWKVWSAPSVNVGRFAGRMEFPDAEAEVKAAALWAGGVLLREPGARVGIVTVRAEEARALIERILPAQLMPLSTVAGSGAEHPPFDLSLGGPLADEPLAHAALALLSACDGERPLAEWRSLLSSRFLNLGPDHVTGAALARFLTKGGRARQDIEGLMALLRTGALSGTIGAGETAMALEKIGALVGAGNWAAPSDWAARFTAALGAACWARTFTLSSREYQCVGKFGEAVSSLGGLDGIVPSCTLGRALGLLKSIAASPFRPKVGEAPIRVLGMLEAAGLEFTHLWVMGASDRNLPPQTRSNPFIPHVLQLKAGVRQASPSEGLARAREIVERLKSSSPVVVFSSAVDAEGAHCAPSPLLTDLPSARPEFMEDLSLAAQVATAGRAKIVLEPDESLPMAAGEEIRGGSLIFAWQAQCPFRAYVGLRLGVEGEREVGEGIDGKLRGTILHQALKTLHTIFPDYRSLRAATEREVEAALDRAIADGLRGADGMASDAMLKVESRRMRETLRDWLKVELERPDFRVLEREAARNLIIGSIPVKLRLDRLDSTEGGDLILDYKTTPNRLSTAQLTRERLTEPQLPLYALACDDARGVAYAVMERGGCKLCGVAECASAPGVDPRPDWEELKAVWRRKLEELGAEFERGRADADPGGRGEFCKYCGMDRLCRSGGPAPEAEE